MKQLILAPAFLASAAFAASDFHHYETFRKMLVSEHLDGQTEATKALAASLLNTLPSDHALRSPTAKTLARLTGTDAPTPAEIAFATGQKTEYYCKGAGLVYMEAKHADGGWSRLALVQNERKVAKDSYSLVTGGQWVYELANNYRHPIRSQIWAPLGNPSAYTIIEVRDHGDGKVDKGMWDFTWKSLSDSHMRWSVTTEEDSPEPARLSVATQYQNWGSWDLGFNLVFQEHYKDSLKMHVPGHQDARINIVAAREVEEHLPEFSFKDAQEQEYTYQDCYKVNVVIQQDAAAGGRRAAGRLTRE